MEKGFESYLDVFIPLAYMTVTLFAQDLKNTSSLIFHLLPSHADYCIRSYTKWNRNMLLCDSPFLSGFPLYFRFIVAWCEEFRISIPAFPFLAKLMTPANSILSFCCLQFWFGFWTLWEFIEQNSFKLSFFFPNETSILIEVRPARTMTESSPHPPGTGSEFIQ